MIHDMTRNSPVPFGPGHVHTALACIAALLFIHHPPVDAQQAGATDAPPLVVFAPSKAGADQAPLSADAVATLETIQSDPSASDIQIGHSNPEPVIAARALSLALPSASAPCTDSGQGAIDFTDVEVTYNEEDMVSLYARDDTKDSEVSLVIQGPDVLGSVRCGDETYKVHPLGGGTTAVYQFDASQLRQHPEGWGEFISNDWEEFLENWNGLMQRQAPDTTPRGDHGAPDVGADAGDEIDVLVAYTPAARRAAVNIDTFIQFAINNTHRAYDNSRIGLRLRLVHRYQVNYSQHSDMEADLDRLTFNSTFRYSDGTHPDPEGYMDEVHGLRDRYGADLVVLIVAAQADRVCGIAWVPPFDDSRFGTVLPALGFSVVAHNCEAVDHFTFAHELGHNQGASHDPHNAEDDDGNDTARFPYAHGFCNTAKDQNTVMAYQANRLGTCRNEIPYFSSPIISYQGTPTGDAAVRDNRRVLRETAQRVANFRQARPQQTDTLTLPFVPPASNTEQQGFVRIINNSDRDGEVEITAIDDSGRAGDPVTLSLNAREAAHFNSRDLEDGNSEKGLSGRTGRGSGNWRLVLETDLEIEHLAYIRTSDGFVTNMHEVAAEIPEGSNRYHVPFLNPGRNRNQQSKLRLINPGSSRASIEITGVDDKGRPPRLGPVQLTLDAGNALILTAGHLENGHSRITGRLGAGTGKWRLSVSADRPIQVMSLLELPTGHLTNLSRGQDGVSAPRPPANQPDLVVASLSASPETPSPGQFVLLSATVRNQGSAQSAATRLRFYRSSDATITRTDTPLQNTSINALSPSGATNPSISVQAPSAAGSYYYGACVDPVPGETNTGNNCSSAVRVTVSGPSGNSYGAIASGWAGHTCGDGFGWGYALNHPDSNSATSAAESACRRLGLRLCSWDVWFTRCGALAYGESSARCGLYGGHGATRSAAEQDVLSKCRADYSTCRIAVDSASNTNATYCNSGAGAAPLAEAQSGSSITDTPFGASNPDARPEPKSSRRRSDGE